MCFHIQFVFNKIVSHFPHRVQYKILYCGGGHLGFLIDKKIYIPGTAQTMKETVVSQFNLHMYVKYIS
jgi:hypothetical protein